MINKSTFDEIIKKIKDAEFVLIGVGEELSSEKLIDLNDDEVVKNMYHPLNSIGIYNYKDLKDSCQSIKTLEFIFKALKNKYIKSNLYNNILNNLSQLIENKDYFVITTNTDALLNFTNISKDRIVSPCGNELILQCSKPCNNQVWNLDLDAFIYGLAKENLEFNDNILPKCHLCGETADLNIRVDNKYVEQGYLNQWNNYMTWLQRTLNKKLVLLELGEGFKTPTVIRWPFEKTAFINNKANLIRINEKFPQISQEIFSKAISLSVNSKDFLTL